MSIQKVNSPSFKGIRKVVRTISAKEAEIIQNVLNKDKTLSFMLPSKSNLLTQIINFYNGEKFVGILHKYKDGSFTGFRTFADGTSVSYSAHKILTKKFGETFFSEATVKGKGILASKLPYKPFDKKGNIITPTLKEIKEFNKPENIINLIKQGKLQVTKAQPMPKPLFLPLHHDGFVHRV